MSVSSLCSKISLGISLSLFENAHVVTGTFFNRLKAKETTGEYRLVGSETSSH